MNLQTEFQPSRLLLIWLVCLHAGAALICGLYLPVPAREMGIVAVVVSLAVSVHARIRLRGSDAVLGIAFDGHCWQLIGNGWRKDARLLATVVWPFLVVLQFQTNDRRRYHLLVMRDAVAPSMFAQLRVAARLASLPG